MKPEVAESSKGEQAVAVVCGNGHLFIYFKED